MFLLAPGQPTLNCNLPTQQMSKTSPAGFLAFVHLPRQLSDEHSSSSRGMGRSPGSQSVNRRWLESI